MDNATFPDGLKPRFDHIDEKLEAIHEYAVKTNGRFSSLERWSLVFIATVVVCLSTNSEGALLILKILPLLK
jgi:hypothetical protein